MMGSVGVCQEGVGVVGVSLRPTLNQSSVAESETLEIVRLTVARRSVPYAAVDR